MSAAAALPDVFLPYQQRFMAAIDAHPVVVVEKSRRTGFTWAAAAVAALKAGATRAARGSDVFYMGYEKDMTREFVDEVATWAKLLGKAASAVEEDIWPHPDDPEKSITVFRIRFASGFEVVALPSVARALRGKQGLVILDEAAFHDDLEAVITAALALRIWGSHVVIVSTHDGDQNPFNVLVADIRAGRRPYHLMRLTFDEAIAEGLYRRICLKNGQEWTPEAEAKWRAEILAEHGDKADQELHVIPSPSTGTFIPATLIEARSVALVPVLRWQCDADFTMKPKAQREAAAAAFIMDEIAPAMAGLSADDSHAFGWDIARRGDVSVFWPLAITRTLLRRTPFTVELRTVPFEQQQQILWWMIERLPRKRAGKMDATGLGMDLAERTIQKFGAWIEAVMLSEPWYRENMPPLKAGFEDGTLEIPADRDTQTDIRMLKLVRGVARVPDRTRDAEGQQRHGDAAIALALAHAATRAEPEAYGYQPAGRPASGADADDFQDRFETRRLTA
jgi:phage FluMu gp28-like protein